MNKKLKNKKNIFVIGAIGVAFLIGISGTYAYFSDFFTINNEFTVNSTYGVDLIEKFESPTNWTPGQEVTKEVSVKNNGNINAVVRLSINEQWLSGTEELSLVNDNNEKFAIINFPNLNSWIKIGDYYYYNKVLKPNDETNLFIDKVTLNENVGDEFECSPTTTNGVMISNCRSTSAYANAKYILGINMESVQVEGMEETWGITLDDLA